MKFGVQVRATAEGVDLVWLARALEARGFESVFLPEHTHVPVNRSSVHPGGEELMDAARRGIDPFIGLAVIAGSTERLRLGTGICLLPQHDPIVLAKQVATLDVLSGGRVILGVGAGWAREEMANHGVDPARRWDLLREKTLAVKALWTQEQASFEGELVRFGPVWQWPKPAQQPHPQILIGGEGPRVLERVVEYGDGWIPNWEADMPDRAAELGRLAADAGRGPLPITVYATPADPAVIAACMVAGVERICFNLPSNEMDETDRALERLTKLIEALG